MSWMSYIDTMIAPESDGTIILEDAAICGMKPGEEAVWASTPGFKNITAEEIRKLASASREGFHQHGPCISQQKCRLIRDNLDDEVLHCMDLKSSADGGSSLNVCVGKTITALVIGKGKKESNGGQVSKKVHNIVEYLRKAGV